MPKKKKHRIPKILICTTLYHLGKIRRISGFAPDRALVRWATRFRPWHQTSELVKLTPAVNLSTRQNAAVITRKRVSQKRLCRFKKNQNISLCLPQLFKVPGHSRRRFFLRITNSCNVSLLPGLLGPLVCEAKFTGRARETKAPTAGTDQKLLDTASKLTGLQYYARTFPFESPV